MIKIISIILLLLCMVVSLSACGENVHNNINHKEEQEITDLEPETKMVEESTIVGKDHKFAEVTIEGNKYNLSRDFEDVIKDLTGNGIKVGKFLVGASLKPYVYNEECKVVMGEKISDIQLYADYAPVSQYKVSGIQPLEDSGDMVIKIFELWQ